MALIAIKDQSPQLFLALFIGRGGVEITGGLLGVIVGVDGAFFSGVLAGPFGEGEVSVNLTMMAGFGMNLVLVRTTS